MMVKENRRRKRKARKSKYYAWAYEEKPRKKSGTFKPPVLQQFQIAGDTFGSSASDRLLMVAHTERGDRIRIISARELTRPERKAYEEEIKRRKS
jgi:hypothetical protein